MDGSKKSGMEEKALDAARLLRLTAKLALYGAAGYACGIAELPFGSSPFGVALLSAADRNAPFVYVGLVLSCLFTRGQTDGAVYLGIYTALLLLRALVRLTVANDGRASRRSVSEIAGMLFGEPCAYRIMLSAVAALGLGACIFFGGGMLYYDLFGLLLSTAVSPIATALLTRSFEGRGVMRDIGRLTLFALCTYGAAELNIYGVSVSLFTALILTFLVTEREGMGKGCVCGLVLGIVYSPILAPSCVFAALCFGIFMKVSPTIGLTTAFLSAVVWAFYVKGINALNGILGAVLASALLYSAGRRLFATDARSRANKAAERRCRVIGDGELDGVRLSDVNRRMSAISEGLSGLSAFFEELKLRYPQERDLRRICLEAFECSCVGCPQEKECPQRQHLEGEAARLAFLLRRNRGLGASDLTEDTVGRCTRLPDILDEINYNAGLCVARGGERGEVIAPDYKALSRLLERGLEDSGAEYVTDRTLSESLCAVLDRLALDIDGVAVFGKRRRTVYVRSSSVRILNEGRSAILEALSTALPFGLDSGSVRVCRCSDGGGSLSVSEAARLCVERVTRQRIAREETDFCGDSIAVFDNADALAFSLISDGMGSGRSAAAVSEICTRFLESMLRVGRMNGELLSMLGGFLSGRCEGSLCECSATVDLMEIDLISGETVFFKSGAAPTYIYRDGGLFKLRAGTMPIGILPDSECRRCELTLSAGDVVVMVSDGVTDGEEECPWLFDILRQNIEQSGAERTAELIVKYAVAHGSRDDISVIVSRVVRS